MKKKAIVVLFGLISIYLILYINRVKLFRKNHFLGSFDCISKIKRSRKRYIKVER